MTAFSGKTVANGMCTRTYFTYHAQGKVPRQGKGGKGTLQQLPTFGARAQTMCKTANPQRHASLPPLFLFCKANVPSYVGRKSRIKFP